MNDAIAVEIEPNHLNAAQWASVWFLASLVLDEERPEETSLYDDLSSGEVPDHLKTIDPAGEVTITTMYRATAPEVTGVSLVFDQVDRDCFLLLSGALGRLGYAVVARASTGSEDGCGEDGGVFAREGIVIRIICATPQYCDDEADANVTVDLLFGEVDALARFTAEATAQLNATLLSDVSDHLRWIPEVQKVALAAMLQNLSNEQALLPATAA